MKTFLTALAFASMLGLVRCSSPVAGSGSDSPNALTGNVYQPTGLNHAGPLTPAPDAEVGSGCWIAVEI